MNGFIIAVQDLLSNSTTFDVFTKADLVSYGFVDKGIKLNAQKVQTILNYFNYIKFNTNTYKLQDIRMLPDSIRSKYARYLDKDKLIGKYQFKSPSTPEASSNNLMKSMSVGEQFCWTTTEGTEWWYNLDGDQCNCNGDEYYAYTDYQTTTICIYSSGVGGFGGGGRIGSGGGFSPTVSTLSNQLGLLYAQSLWLENNPLRTNEILSYLDRANGFTQQETNEIALGHLELMM